MQREGDVSKYRHLYTNTDIPDSKTDTRHEFALGLHSWCSRSRYSSAVAGFTGNHGMTVKIEGAIVPIWYAAGRLNVQSPGSGDIGQDSTSLAPNNEVRRCQPEEVCIRHKGSLC